MLISPSIVDFSTDGKTGKPILGQAHSFPHFDQATQELQPLSLAPGAKAQLKLQINVPQGAPNREYPLTVLFAASPATEFTLNTSAAQVSGTIGSNVVILVSDETTPPTDLQILSFQTMSIVDSFRPLSFKPVVENKGYAASVASGSAQVKNWHGSVLKEFAIEPVIILGSSRRELQPLKTEELVAERFSYKPLFLFGVYRVQVALQSGDTDSSQQVLKSEVVIALPIGLFGLVVIAVLTYFGYKRAQIKLPKA